MLLAVAVAAGVGLALAVGLPEAGAKKDYSGYADPEKPVLSFVLSGDQNVEEFQREFGLSDEEVQEVLAVVHDEDGALTEEYDESEQIVASNRSASDAKIKEKIFATDFDEKVRQTVARTKSEVEDILPADRAEDLGPWVDEQWQAEAAAADYSTYRASRRGHTCKVWTSYYGGNTRYEVALPHQRVKFTGGRKVGITPVNKGKHTRAPVKETGPWNTRDNYWQIRSKRSMWRGLPRCLPEAQAAFFKNFHRGRDQFGRKVLNPAGMDITLDVARSMNVGKKIKRQGYIKVRLYFPWVRR